eukprot:320473_1
MEGLLSKLSKKLGGKKDAKKEVPKKPTVVKGSGVVSKVKQYTLAKKQSIENEEASVLKNEQKFQKWLEQGRTLSPGNVHVHSKVSGIPPLVALKQKLAGLKALATGGKKEIIPKPPPPNTKHGFLITPNNLKSQTKDRELGGDVVVKIDKDKTKGKKDTPKKTSAYMNDYNKYEYVNDYYDNNEYLNDYNEYNQYDANDYYNMDYGQYDANNYYVPQQYINSDYKVNNAEMISLGVLGMVFACFMMVIIGCICTGIGYVIMKNMKQNVNVKHNRVMEEVEDDDDDDD